MFNDSGSTLDALLEAYYRCQPRDAERLEARMLNELRRPVSGWLRKNRFSPTEQEDLEQQVLLKLLRKLRAGLESPAERIREGLIAYTRKITESVAADEGRRDNPARRQMLQKIRYLTTDTRWQTRFGRWQTASLWLVGLREWLGRAFTETSKYQDFCADDTSFCQSALKGNDPQQVPFAHLLLCFFRWIETPLLENTLLDVLFQLRSVQRLQVISLSHTAVYDVEKDPAMAVTIDMEPGELDWDACWQEIQRFSPVNAAAVLLNKSPEQLIILTGLSNPRPLLAQSLQLPPEKIAEIWPALPLEDNEAAELMQVRLGTLHVSRSRSCARLQKLLDVPRRP